METDNFAIQQRIYIVRYRLKGELGYSYSAGSWKIPTLPEDTAESYIYGPFTEDEASNFLKAQLI
jgi:hypothetical protein